MSVLGSGLLMVHGVSVTRVWGRCLDITGLTTRYSTKQQYIPEVNDVEMHLPVASPSLTLSPNYMMVLT